jgi:DNA-binding CsgD family transcriptional regulator
VNNQTRDLHEKLGVRNRLQALERASGLVLGE